MPRGDRTGPTGVGAMTGREAGYCSGHTEPGCMDPAPRRRGGARRGAGRRRGRRHGYGRRGVPEASPAYVGAKAGEVPATDANAWQAQARQIAESFADINRRLAELEKASVKEA